VFVRAAAAHASEKSLGSSGLRLLLVDWGTFAVLIAVIATYLRRCLWRDGIGKAALLAVVIAAAAPGYRFLIFLVTLYYT
jgi:hypothetical protein